MTATTPINISTQLYNQAADYARKHNTSVEKMTESYFLALMTFIDLEKQPEQTQEVEIAHASKTEKDNAAKEWWQNYPISEEIKRMSMGKAINIPDDDKAALQKILSEEYESLS